MKKIKIAIWRFFAEETNREDLLRAIFAGFILTVVFSLLPFFVSCEKISNEVLRLHVIANSDSDEDQALKLEVRDAVLLESAKWYEGAESFTEANGAVCMHLQSIEAAAQEVLARWDCEDTLSVEVTDMYFETRDYETFSLPAGKYRTLRVTIGEGRGKNWWCMVYPALCLPVAESEKSEIDQETEKSKMTDEDDTTEKDEKEINDKEIDKKEIDDILSDLTEDERDIIENPQNFVIRFQILEWYKKLIASFDK